MAALFYSRSAFFESRPLDLRAPRVSTRRAASRRPSAFREFAARAGAVAGNALLCLWALLVMAVWLVVIAGVCA
jgi:hypothetical protein